jgi:hypothetical protein
VFKPNGTPGEKPPAPSLKVRRGRPPLEQRSGNKSAPTVHGKTNEVEPGKSCVATEIFKDIGLGVAVGPDAQQLGFLEATIARLQAECPSMIDIAPAVRPRCCRGGNS